MKFLYSFLLFSSIIYWCSADLATHSVEISRDDFDSHITAKSVLVAFHSNKWVIKRGKKMPFTFSHYYFVWRNDQFHWILEYLSCHVGRLIKLIWGRFVHFETKFFVCFRNDPKACIRLNCTAIFFLSYPNLLLWMKMNHSTRSQ